MKILLSEEDAARLGCPRDLVFDLNKLMAREALVLQRTTGWTPDRLASAMEGKVVLDANGQPAYQQDEHGADVLDEHGKRIPLRELDIEPILVAAWIAARRRGCVVPYDDFDFDVLGVDYADEPEPDAVDGAGKE